VDRASSLSLLLWKIASSSRPRPGEHPFKFSVSYRIGGIEIRMRRFSLPNKIRRCQNGGDSDQSVRREASWHDLPDSLQAPSELTFAPGISAEQRAHFLDQGDLFCRMCGTSPGDIDDLTGLRAKFRISLSAERNTAGKGELSKFQTLCSTCEEGVRDLRPSKPPAIWLLSQIRRAGQEEQRAVLDWLLKKFKK